MKKPAYTLTATETLKSYKKQALSPIEATQAAFDRITEINPHVNAFAALNQKQAIPAARESEKRWHKKAPLGPLDGVPVTIKDWYDVTGLPTRMGSLTTSKISVRKDSLPVALLRKAGAIIIGKTTLPEYGHKGVTDSKLSGITRNPWNLGKTCGGSSGGAAVAAVTGMGCLHLGSDAGGSIRIPASFCGAVGFKPSPGLVPSWPPSLFATMSSAGPITRSVADAKLMFEVLASSCEHDWHNVAELLPTAPKKKIYRVAYADNINDIRAEKHVREILESALQQSQNFCDIEIVKLQAPRLIETFNAHWMAVAAKIATGFSAAQKKNMDPRFLHWAKRGEKLSRDAYLQAEYDRMIIGGIFKQLLTKFDILITPTTAMTAFDAGQNMPVGARGKLWDDWTPFTYPANLARLPAITIPCGFSQKTGLPVGLQAMAGYMQDHMLLEFAKRLEHRLGNAL